MLWDKIKAFRKKVRAWFWAACGNSRTILVAYLGAIALALPDLKLVNWGAIVGLNRGEMIGAAITILMIVMRLVTAGGVSFKPKSDEGE